MQYDLSVMLANLLASYAWFRMEVHGEPDCGIQLQVSSLYSYSSLRSASLSFNANFEASDMHTPFILFWENKLL